MKSRFFAVIVALAGHFPLASAGPAWDTAVIDDFIESVRKCRDRPAISIAIIKLDENDEIEHSYANAYGRNDPTCATNCDRVSFKEQFLRSNRW